MGDQVLWSDLYALKFDPTEASYHYGSAEMATSFDPLKAQEAAFEAGELPSEVVEEVEKLIRADRVIFHFPLWWFAPPAMLKGYFDRVFVHGLPIGFCFRFVSVSTVRFAQKQLCICADGISLSIRNELQVCNPDRVSSPVAAANNCIEFGSLGRAIAGSRF